jgi:biotin carboxyl carrier protein
MGRAPGVGRVKISAKAGSQVYDLLIERENGFYTITIDGERHQVDARKLEDNFYTILTGNRSYEISVEPAGDGYLVRHGAAEQLVQFHDPSRGARDASKVPDGPLQIVSEMPGKVARLLVAEGDEVAEGQPVIVIEAMKMENEIATPKAGSVKSIAVEPGATVEGGAVLLVIE